MGFAVIKFKDGTRRMCNPKQATEMFMVQQGLLKATPEQQEYVAKIERVMLNWYAAPQEYRDKYPRSQPQPDDVVTEQGIKYEQPVRRDLE